MGELRLRSEDGRFGIQVDEGHVERILAFCREAGRAETGGILLGRYSRKLDAALVTGVLGPTPDSTKGARWFHRGVLGLQHIIEREWRNRREHYIGEWHFHPFEAPTPSGPDVVQMNEIAASPNWKCPEPVLLIIGGDPADAWSAHASIVLKNGTSVVLDPAVSLDR